MTGVPAVTREIQEHVATLQFSNPAQRGALTPQILHDLRAGLTELEREHPAVRVVVLRGTDGTFSSGYAIDHLPRPESLAVKDEIEELCQALEASPLVVIALLRGVVVGAALDVASACDFRYADSHCRLGITPAKLGLVYSVAGSARIHRLVGSASARLLFYTGDLVSAPQAAAMGLVTNVCDGAEELESETYALARRIAARAPLSVAGSKRIFRAIEMASAVDPVAIEALHELRRDALRSADSVEARVAFTEKRAPAFMGGSRQ
jgi:enoyl-CoA hydratase/carnithine racemase